MSNSPFTNITVAGGTGGLGYHIAEALLNDGSFNVKILRRLPKTANEKADLLASKGAEIVYADYNQHDDLVNVLRGTDALISAAAPGIATGNHDFDTLQTPLLNAAKAAGVRRFYPSEFGIESEIGDHIETDTKAAFREKVEKSGLEYTNIMCGLASEYLGTVGFDVKNKTAKFYIDGDTILSTIYLADIGKYTAESLKMEESRNATLKVAGSRFSLNQILEKLEEATGSKWQVVVDKDIKNRFLNKIDPVPSPMDFFTAVIVGGSSFPHIDNDKFNFSPRPLDIDEFVRQESV
ncbi:5604_t:CDS:2 [Paraglomus brasilianum]|uniref:5604_t:CDS:1 n=1 Tax=Paraglomus brasilianum TaxID=144538 RepID=A0A9N9C778_9GLOM|nr:5604_t:CDS:2 [Paraglomus brasilianum]